MSRHQPRIPTALALGVCQVADDGTWDGSEEDAIRLPIVDVGRDLCTDEEDMSREEIIEAFARKGVEAEW